MLIDGLALREVVPRNRLANPAASSFPFARTVADRPALSHRRRWLIRCPMPLEKFAARAFGFSPPVPVSKKSANSCSIADRTAANMAWARSTSAQWPKKKLSAPLRQHLQSKNSPIAGATYSSAACIRSTSIFAIATVPVVTTADARNDHALCPVAQLLRTLSVSQCPLDSGTMVVDCRHSCRVHDSPSIWRRGTCNGYRPWTPFSQPNLVADHGPLSPSWVSRVQRSPEILAIER